MWIAATCVRAAEACFALGCGNVVYDASPLPRWLRDLPVAAQHRQIQQRHYAGMGKLLPSDPVTCLKVIGG